MRVLRREPDPALGAVDTTSATAASEAGAIEATTKTKPAAPAAPAVTERAVVREPDDTLRPATPTPTTRESEVVLEHWSIADALAALIGAGLALIGAIALIRTGVDRSWFRPVVQVADADHTALLGGIELGAGVLLMLAATTRVRALTTLLGLAGAVGGALAAIENAEVSRELAIEESWAWMLAGIGLLVVLVSLVPPRRRRVERLVES
jgi:hypothetical protein